MKRTFLSLAVVGIVASGALASGAAASGPAPPGKHLVQINCEGLGTIEVSVSPSEHATSVGQVVAQKLHGIPVETVFSATDVRTGEVFGGTTAKGGGHAHHNQSTISCESTPEEIEAAAFFGEEGLPEGVSPTDTIRVQFAVRVILKP